LNNNHNKNPLVSVGIPTYNRLAGLRRTLEYITRQTYQNLEIIVSDNCSPNTDIDTVMSYFMASDPRISYFRQPTNRGIVENYNFVLEKSSGEYFMWAADDDEWEPDFIDRCLSEMSGFGSVMCEFETVYRLNGRIEKNQLPSLGSSGSVYADALAFINLMQPTLVNGLHRRSDIQFILDKQVYFDFYDCYFILRQILGPGFKTIQGVSYRAGIEKAEYQLKTLDSVSRKLNYMTIARRVLPLFLLSRKLNQWQKVVLSATFLKVLVGLYAHHERERKPWLAFFINKLL